MGERRVAIVTGGSSGIGRATAAALAGLGWAVGIGARGRDRLEDAARELRAAGGEACSARLDVRDPDSVRSFFAAVEEALGPVDALVNNAGASTPGALETIPPDTLRSEVETNLLGPMLASRLAIASMRGRGARGDLVFVSSDAARNARPRMAAYSATKAGVEALARSLAMELEGTGIRSTTLRVGPTLSQFGAGWDRHQLEELMAFWPRYGLQRHDGVLQPEDVARAVVTILTAPAGVHLDTVEVQPEAPPGSGRARIFEP